MGQSQAKNDLSDAKKKQEDHNKELSTSAIIGIAAVCLVGVLILIVAVILLMKFIKENRARKVSIYDQKSTKLTESKSTDLGCDAVVHIMEEEFNGNNSDMMFSKTILSTSPYPGCEEKIVNKSKQLMEDIRCNDLRAENNIDDKCDILQQITEKQSVK